MRHQLDFEKPIVELQNKLDELKKHRETSSLGISFEEEVALIEKKLEDKHRKELHALLEKSGIAGQVDISEFRRYGSARRLYNFHVDNASAY